MYLLRSAFVFGWLVSGVLAAAAAPANAFDGKVRGVVTIDGQPMSEGRILFHLEAGQFVGCYIEDGKYRIDRVPGGARRMTIEGPGSPAKFADANKTGLVVDIVEGDNEFNLDLTSE